MLSMESLETHLESGHLESLTGMDLECCSNGLPRSLLSLPKFLDQKVLLFHPFSSCSYALSLSEVSILILR